MRIGKMVWGKDLVMFIEKKEMPVSIHPKMGRIHYEVEAGFRHDCLPCQTAKCLPSSQSPSSNKLPLDRRTGNLFFSASMRTRLNVAITSGLSG